MFFARMSLFDFDSKVGFWGDASSIWNRCTQEEKEYLDEIVSECFFKSLGQVNDFIWFDAEGLLEERQENED